jgi:hypothetical protein
MFCKQVLKVKGKHRQILPPLETFSVVSDEDNNEQISDP